jgi:hypothetical protein
MTAGLVAQTLAAVAPFDSSQLEFGALWAL